MDSAKWKIVKETFSAVTELPLEARENFWKDFDPKIKYEVENLLAAHEKAADFIAEPVLINYELTDNKDEADLTGKYIGSYQIIEKIGVGGMGVVYLAERVNANFRQKVALKLIKRGMDSEAVLQRFILERQILAQLEHPNIARLIDGGSTDDGLPYFVMEYVEGETVTKFCNKHSLDVKERLELFRTVCAAVSYAHQNLIVHRDLKPSNILITKDGVPKLLDFGIAKILSPDRNADYSENTVTIARMFTPEYASPEHLQGKSTTTATDVYSLGVILYELLTGKRPYNFKDKSFSESTESIVTTDPVRPSSVITDDFFDHSKAVTNPNIEPTGEIKQSTKNDSSHSYKLFNPNALKGDIDNIVLKAIRRDPKRRYQSVSEFSEDIFRHLNGLPVSAMADTSIYRFTKFVERHRAGVLISSGFIILIMIVSTVAVWQAIAARKAQARAEMRFNQVREIANTVLFDYYDKIEQLPGTIELRQKIVSDSVNYLDNLAAENADDISLKRELVKAYDKVSEVQFGLINGNIGDSAGALKSATKAVEIAEEITQDQNANSSDWQILADMYLSLAGARGETGDLAADVAYKEKAIKIYENIYNADQNNIEAENNLAKAYFYIATPMKFTGNSIGAIENFQKAAAIYEKLSKQVPDDPKYVRSVALSYKYLAPVYLEQKKLEEAVSAVRKSVEIDEQRLNSSTSSFQIKYDLSRSYEALAAALSESGKISEAENSALKSAELTKEVSDANPKNYYYHDSYGISLKTLALVRQKQNRSDEAVKLLTQAISGWEATVQRDPTDVFTKVFLANAYTQLGEIYLSSAENRSALQTKENLIKAKDWFNKSEILWQELKNNQAIFKYYEKDFERVRTGIRKCDWLSQIPG
jgi:eukaryotic-like serine/threonine-protein kinase